MEIAAAEESTKPSIPAPRVLTPPPLPEKDAPRESPREGLSIVKFLKSRRMLVTGATGFLAKVLVEKILREQPEVGRIYLLIQARGDQTADARLHDMITSSPLFDRLRETHGPGYEAFMRSKLVAVTGNLTRKDLGLDADTLAALVGEVEVFVNSAASTSFDERYDAAVRLNSLGALECARFAARCSRLASFVHVSTAFVNGQRQGYTAERPFDFGRTVSVELRRTGDDLDVDAEVAEALAAPGQIAERLRASGLSGADLEQAVERELVTMGMQRAAQHGWQDTYVFTKAMGEMLLRREVEAQGVPCCVVRPSIVESTWREPMPGWIEGLRMSDPIIIAYGKAQMVGFAGDRKGVLDVVPCDIVINACLAAMVKHARCTDTHTTHAASGALDRSSSGASCSGSGGGGSKPLTVYHVATSTANPLNIQRFVELVTGYFRNDPMSDRGGGTIQVEDMIIYRGFYHMVLDTWRRYALPWQIRELQEKLMPWDASKKLSSEERKTVRHARKK